MKSYVPATELSPTSVSIIILLSTVSGTSFITKLFTASYRPGDIVVPPPTFIYRRVLLNDSISIFSTS